MQRTYFELHHHVLNVLACVKGLEYGIKSIKEANSCNQMLCRETPLKIKQKQKNKCIMYELFYIVNGFSIYIIVNECNTYLIGKQLCEDAYLFKIFEFRSCTTIQMLKRAFKFFFKIWYEIYFVLNYKRFFCFTKRSR